MDRVSDTVRSIFYVLYDYKTMLDSAMQPTKTSVPSATPTTTTLLVAPGIEENAGAGTGRDLGRYEQETPQIQNSNNQMLQAKRNSANCATAAARHPPFEAPTWRHFAGDWR